VFLFFMITDPRTIPETGRGRRLYAVSVGLLATLLIAPWTSEFSAKLAVLGALTIVCAARPLLLLAAERTRLGRVSGWSPASAVRPRPRSRSSSRPASCRRPSPRLHRWRPGACRS
jgi:hypothetical protein